MKIRHCVEVDRCNRKEVNRLNIRRCVKLIKFLGRRLVYMLISLWVIVTATFFLMRAIPGGPFSGAPEKGPPGIALIRKKVAVTITQREINI